MMQRDESTHAAILRCQINQKKLTHAAEYFELIDSRLEKDSMIHFLRTDLASAYEIKMQWKPMLHHSLIAANKRIDLLLERPDIAHWTVMDLKESPSERFA